MALHPQHAGLTVYSRKVPVMFSKQLLVLSLALSLSACSTLRVSPGDSFADLVDAAGKTVVENSQATLLAKMTASARSPGDSTAAAALWLSGRSMLDLRCQRYVDSVGMTNQSAANERKQTGLAGGVITALMGLTGSPAKQISGVGSLFSFAGSSMDVYTSTFLFSDAAKSIRTIVELSQNKFLEEVSAPATYADAINFLVAYEALCRPPHIRSMIDQAIAQGKVASDGAPATAASLELAIQENTVRGALANPKLSADDIVKLYAWLTSPDERSEGAKLNTIEPMKTLLAQPKTPTLEQTLQIAFVQSRLPGSSVAKGYEPLVKKLIADRKPPAAPAAPTAPTSQPQTKATSLARPPRIFIEPVTR
jgi:hypothetical protein